MNKQELIDELKKEIEVIRNNADWEERVETYGKGKRVGLEFGWMLAEKLDEPDQVVCAENERTNQLVEVPQFVADWIEHNKFHSRSINQAMDFNPDKNKKVWQWLHCGETYVINQDEFARAWLYGYTIEPPKTLQVIVKNYDSTVFKTELPEDEAMKLIKRFKEDAE